VGVRKVGSLCSMKLYDCDGRTDGRTPGNRMYQLVIMHCMCTEQ